MVTKCQKIKNNDYELRNVHKISYVDCTNVISYNHKLTLKKTTESKSNENPSVIIIKVPVCRI